MRNASASLPEKGSIDPVSQCVSGSIAIPEQIGSALPISSANQNGMLMPFSSNGVRRFDNQNANALAISATAVAKNDTRDAFQNSTGVEISERIRTLAAQGLKVRDISSLLHIHPQVVIRELGR